MKAPEKCVKCQLGEYMFSCCPKAVLGGSSNPKMATPGPECPFVLLAAKDAALAKIREAKIDYTNPEEYFGLVRSALKEVK